jgi:hypothetical protein
MMTDYALVQSRCGLRCNECEWVEKANCPGCLNAHGKPFHGECVVAICCEDRDLLHCGKCDDFPCEKLIAFAYDSEHGDNGERIETLRKWLSEE